MGLFGKAPQQDPKQLTRKWCASLRQEKRNLDREIRTIEREQAKVKMSLKQSAKKNELDVCKILAKELVHSNKAISRIHTAKAQINSVEMTVKNQAAMVRMAGALEKSSDVMQLMSKLIKLPQIQQSMQALSKEMMKAGLVEEMMDDAMDTLETESDEEAADYEVDKILFDITAGAMGKAPDKVEDELPAVAGPSTAESDSEEEDEMRQRLDALKS